MIKKPETLIKQRKRLVRSLPLLDEVLRGSVFERRRRCGKSYCHCAHGEGHRTFYLTVTFSSGKTEQISLPRELVPMVRRWVKNYRRCGKILEDISAINRKLIRAERKKIKDIKNDG